MLFELIQGNVDVLVDAKAPRDPNEIFHGEMVGVFDGGLREGESIARKVCPRKIFVTGSYTLIEFKGPISEED